MERGVENQNRVYKVRTCIAQDLRATVGAAVSHGRELLSSRTLDVTKSQPIDWVLRD